MLYRTFFRSFSSTVNYANTFKLRSRLSDFFKHVHPDQLQQAPTNVRQQNMRSLTNFNSYIDSLNQGKHIEAKLLKFYIAEKINNKSKKFYSFTLQLPEITQNVEEKPQQTGKKVEKLMDDIVQALNKKFEESKTGKMLGKTIKTKKAQKIGSKSEQSQQKELKFQSNEQRFKNMSQTVGPFQKYKQGHDQLLKEQLQNTITSKYFENERQSLVNQLQRKISFANTATNKPMMWSRLTMKQAGIKNDYATILSNLIDPKLIFFEESLSFEEIDQFKKRMVNSVENNDLKKIQETEKIIEVCEEMQSVTPPLCLYVTKGTYSGTQIPGFYSVPYNFTPKQFYQNFQILKETILEQQQKYEQFYDYYTDLKQELQKESKLHIQTDEITGNDDIWKKILCVKRLQKFKSNRKITVLILNQQGFNLFKFKFCNRQVAEDNTAYWMRDKNKLVVNVLFHEQEVQEIFQQINRQ